MRFQPDIQTVTALCQKRADAHKKGVVHSILVLRNERFTFGCGYSKCDVIFK
jgi:hypothetical protein